MCKRLSAYRLSDSGFAFAANRVRCLKVLQIPMSDVSDKIVEKHAESLASLTVLDISYCSKGLEAVGKSCKFLIQLKRNMPPMVLEETSRATALDETEAMAIANTMPGLNRLELAYGNRFSDCGLNAILANCKALSRLNIEGCLYVDFNGDLEESCDRITDFKAPWFWFYYDDHLLAIAAASDED